MSDIQTRADAIRIYHTGASADDAAQTDPNASLGGNRSSTEVQMLAASVASPIANVTVDYVAGANGLGDGSLNAPTTGTLTWTPPGGTVGPAVEIANGETKVLEGGGADGPQQYIRVTRTSTADLTGTATVTLVDVLNNVVGFDNISSGEASAGDDEYRCLCLRNEHAFMPATEIVVYVAPIGTQQVSDDTVLPSSGAGTIATTGSLATWPASGVCRREDSGGTLQELVYYSSRTDTTLTVPATGRGLLGTTASAGALTDKIYAVPGIRIGLEAPTGDAQTGAFQEPGDESTAPTGITWSTGITAATGLTLASLDVDEIYGLHIHRHVPVGAQSIPNQLHHVKFGFESV